MNNRKIRDAAAMMALLLAISSTLSACKGDDNPTDANGGTSGSTSDLAHADSTNTGNASETVEPETAPEAVNADTPVEGSYAQTTETTIVLGDTVTIEGTGAVAEGSVVTVTAAGTYLISGTLNGGQLVVDTADEGKVTLILNGVSVACSTGPAIYVKSAPKKVVLHTAEGSVNILSDGSDYVVPDEEQVEGEVYPNACIYSCEDIDLTGTGELYVTGNADKGINTKDDLKIKSGTVVVNSVGVGIRANDSLEMSGGTVTVSAGADGIKTANIETEGKGYLTVEGGTLYITATGDGLAAATDLTVSGGHLVITTKDADGSELSQSSGSSTSGSSSGWGGMGRPGSMGGMGGDGNSNKSTISAKGLKAAGTLTVSGGQITITSVDDGVHSDDTVLISGGSLYIKAGDDGIHADTTLTISSGVTEIAQSYEGLEALHINILGGTNRITASDDGTNASDGSGSSMGMGGGMGGMGGWWGGSSSGGTISEDDPLLTIAGGYTVINAAGDGIDSNGSIVMTGGTLLVYGPTDSANGPIDIGDGSYTMTISGGTLLAVGSSGMAESADNAGQAVLAASWRSGGLSAGQTVGIVDKNGNVIAAFELPKSIASIVFSSSAVTAGETYTIVYGGTTTADIVDGVIDPATYTGYTSAGEIEAS